jgi:hypothetical protein
MRFVYTGSSTLARLPVYSAAARPRRGPLRLNDVRQFPGENSNRRANENPTVGNRTSKTVERLSLLRVRHPAALTQVTW